MLSVKQLLAANGLEIPSDQIKLVRHVDHLGRSIQHMIDNGWFDAYQAEQRPSVRPFHNCQAIASFVGVENNKAAFHGVYRVNGCRPLTSADVARLPAYVANAIKDGKPRIWYELEELTAFSSYRGRLVVQWGSTRGWWQHRNLPIYEILPPVVAKPFPGYQDVLLSWTDLRVIYEDPRAHRDWKAALRANAGIYRIVDQSTGEMYIGSAWGKHGLWGRWETYAKTGHGHNKLLKHRDPEEFQWSIVRTVSTAMSPGDVIQIEQREKQKHGSRAHGLNGN